MSATNASLLRVHALFVLNDLAPWSKDITAIHGVQRHVAVQGVTFDCGGLNIKAGAGSMIEMMKFDMGGSGATLGAARALAALQPPGVEVQHCADMYFCIPSCAQELDRIWTGWTPGTNWI